MKNYYIHVHVRSCIVALAVDEAHCVYTCKWGSDFGPTYASVHELRALIPSDTPMLAATAIVTRISLPVIIIQQLNIMDYKLVYMYVPPERPNIYLGVRS